MSKHEIRNIVYKVLKSQVDYPDWESTFNTASNDGEDLLLYSEVGFTSLDTLEFIMDLEEELNISIDDTIFNYQITLGILIDNLYEQINDTRL